MHQHAVKEQNKSLDSHQTESRQGIDAMGPQFSDNRPELIIQQKQLELLNGSQQVLQLQSMQALADKHVASQVNVIQQREINEDFHQDSDEPIQRAIAFDNTARGTDRIVVNDNRPWWYIDNHMPVPAGMARCHIISFENIRLGVWDAITSFLYGPAQGHFATLDAAIVRLRDAVFPYGGTASTHASRHLTADAQILFANIAAQLQIIQRAGHGQEATVAAAADSIVLSMNSSPDNLRVGDAVTNSSIGSALDPRGGDIDSTQRDRLGNRIFVIEGTTALQLLALSAQERRRLVEVYMDANHIQNSEIRNDRAANLAGGQRPIYIKPAGGGAYIPLH